MEFGLLIKPLPYNLDLVIRDSQFDLDTVAGVFPPWSSK